MTNQKLTGSAGLYIKVGSMEVQLVLSDNIFAIVLMMIVKTTLM